MFKNLSADYRIWASSWKRTPSTKLFLRLLIEPGFVFSISLRSMLFLQGCGPIGKLISVFIRFGNVIFFGCDIDRKCIIGPGVHFPHPLGIVIGGGVKIGPGVSILHSVTLGRSMPGVHSAPTIEKGAYICAGAKIFGDVVVGENSVVAANAVLLSSVPPNAIVAGMPAKVKRIKNEENSMRS